MAKQPTVSTDSVAQDQIRAFVERILRMKEEAKAIKDDIREIYAEAKGNGFDKTVLGQVVSYVEKRAKDRDELLEREALFELYMSAFDGTVIDDGETGTERATHTHETNSALTHAADGADAQPVGTAEELQPGSSAPIQIEAPRGVEGEAEGASASPANSIVRFTNKPLRPHCMNPTSCGGYGRTHCGPCQKAHAAGGTTIPVLGEVR